MVEKKSSMPNGDLPLFCMGIIFRENTLWLFNIAMENGPFIDGLHIKMVIVHGYVK
jgi:hypothetical protein